ncbi:DUF1345 domain-containing protein [Actinomadura sp. NEAU-AAG7]|uniref:DUF1345 domain-containing protein n=1 Tax=Actinomadura sp. NEAU-AAG7 TaxID=2839640 RepID=UPI001BE4B637|nr:DUF1345 domain-containing protein [Actinomadura sp. NEAU-AAG7]MBT2207527.1 DUF1345 domain-containing protein [Actinomadura sp. NEAU-AAG7]
MGDALDPSVEENGTGPPRRFLSVRRLGLSLGAGVVGGAAAAVLGAAEVSLLVGWVLATGTILTWVWWLSWPQGPDDTKLLAEAEGDARSTDAAVLLASVASLAIEAHAQIRFAGRQDALSVTAVILVVLAVVLSWALVNTVFAFRYARLYYEDADGGIDFMQTAPPSYSDFAYMAFTVGMASAVSESQPADTRIRRTVLGHALLAYAFGTGILAVAISLVTGIGQG